MIVCYASSFGFHQRFYISAEIIETILTSYLNYLGNPHTMIVLLWFWGTVVLWLDDLGVSSLISFFSLLFSLDDLWMVIYLWLLYIRSSATIALVLWDYNELLCFYVLLLISLKWLNKVGQSKEIRKIYLITVLLTI